MFDRLISNTRREHASATCESHDAVTAGRMQATDVRSIASDPAIIQPNFWPRLGVAALVVLALLAL